MTRNRDAALYAGGLLFQQTLSFFAGVAAARWLGPQAYGEVSLARAIYGVAVIVAPLGLDLSLLRHLGESRAPWSARRAQVRTLRRIVAAVNVALVFAAVCAGPWLEAHVYRHPGFAGELAIACLALPFAADLAILTALARALGRVAPASLTSLYLQPSVRTAALAALLGFGWGARGMLGATVVGLAAADLALAWSLRRGRDPDGPGAAAASPASLAKLFAYSGWMAWMLLAYGGLKLVDVLVLGHARPAREVGDYAAISAIAQLVSLYPIALSQTLGPTVARLYAEGDRAAVRRELGGYARRAALTASPLFAGVAVFGPWLDLVFGSRFHFQTALCLLLAAGGYVSGVFGPMSVSLSMTGRHRLEFAILACGGVLSVCGCLWLAPRYGGLGVGAATLAGYVAVNAARTAVSAWVMGGLDMAAADVLIPLSCLALALGWRSLAERLGGHDVTTLAWIAPGVGASFAALYLGLLLRPGERAALRTFSRRRWRSAAGAAPCRS